MKSVLRKYSLKKVLPLALAAFVLAGALLAYTRLGIFTLLAGPTPVEQLTAEALPGAYIEVDIANMRGEFAAWGNGGTEAADYSREYFGLAVGDDQYIGVCFYRRFFDELDEMTVALNLFYNGEIEDVGLSIRLRGTVREMSDELKGYFYDWFDTSTLPESKNDEGYVEAEHLYPYVLELGRVNGVPDTLVIALSAAALLFILVGAALLLAAGLGFFQRRLPADGAADFDGARQIGGVRVGKKYFWYSRGANSAAVPVQELLWVFPRSRRLEGGALRWKLVFRTQQREELELKMKSAGDIQAVADTLKENGAAIVVGYDADKQKLYTRDFAAFQALARKK